VDSSELIDQGLVILIRRCVGASPGETGNFLPSRGRRPSRVTYQVSRVGQTGAVMAGDAMEKDGLTRSIREQIGGFRHLFHGCARPDHRHDLPSNTGFSHDFRLIDVLGIGWVDRGESHDRLDPLATDDSVQGRRILPASSHQLSRDDHAYTLFGVTLPPSRSAEGGSHCDDDSDPRAVANRERKIHECVIPSRQKRSRPRGPAFVANSSRQAGYGNPKIRNRQAGRDIIHGLGSFST
jgi:hypothetical protein